MKNLIILILIIISLVVVIHRQRVQDKLSLLQEEQTPQQMLEQEMAIKGKRRDDGQYKRFDQPEEYIAYHRMIRTRDGDQEPAYLFGYRQQNLLLAKSARVNQHYSLNATWQERGPANVPGRTRGLLIDPTDPSHSTWIAGSVGGGIWRTYDKGMSWQNLTPHLPNLATTVLATSTSDPDIIYAGTGEGWYGTGMIDGDGILKSTDRGDTWNQLPATAINDDFQNINRIIVDPNDPNILLACSNTGLKNSFKSVIMRSTDGGASWNEVFFYNDRIQHLIFHPDDFTVQYAAIFGFGVIKSVDTGITWFVANQGMAPDGRVEIAISPANPQVLYASCEGPLTGASSDLYISRDAGMSWELIIPQQGGTIYEFLGGQGWFNNTIAVHPFDEDIVFFGGVNLFRSVVSEDTGILSAFLGVDYLEADLIGLVNFGASNHQGRVAVGNLEGEEFTSVEIRFGPGLKQKAHRFTVDKLTAGVPPDGYYYKDYTEVPFEVWDVDNNQQLMVSFRDQQEDGFFDLTQFDEANPGREYLFIHAVPYGLQAHGEIARDAGHVFRQMYMIWPYLSDNAHWIPDNLAKSTLRIRFGQLKTRTGAFTHMSDAYGQYSGLNSFSTSGFHPDHHNLLLSVDNPLEKTFWILNANDGGVFYTEPCTEPGTHSGDWIFAGHGLNTTQFYGADKKPGFDQYIGGSQDNGTWRSPDGAFADEKSQYLFQMSGDGFEAVWHHQDPLKMIGAAQFNQFRRSTNGGLTWQMATTGLSDRGASSYAPFVSRLANSKHDPDVLYAVGQRGVWRSDNFSYGWQAIPMGATWNFGSTHNVEISLSDYGTIWAGGAMNAAGRIHVSTDYGKTFKPVNNYTQVPMGRISGLATHPSQDSTAYVLFSFAAAPKILRTLDMGQNWEDISGFNTSTQSSRGFPDVAVYCLLVMPHNPEIIWVGTEIGLVESHDNGQNWHLYQGDLPSVSVWNMKVVDDQVVLATHGRGIWTAQIEDLRLRPFVRELVQLDNWNKVLLRADFSVQYDSVQVFLNKHHQRTLLFPIAGNNIISMDLRHAGMQKAHLVGYIDGKAYQSAKALREIDQVTALRPMQEENKLRIFPNPTPSGFYIELPVAQEQEMKVSLLDLSGRVVHRESRANMGSNYFNMGHLPQGTYIVRIEQGQHKYSGQVIITSH